MRSNVKKICDFCKMLQEYGIKLFYDRLQIESMTLVGNHIELLMHKSAFTYRLEFVDLDKIYASINWNYIKIIYILGIVSLENPTEEKETMTKIEKFAENLLNYLKDTNYTATYDGVEILGVGVINSNVLSNEIAIRTKNGLVSFNDSETNCINKIKITKSLQVDVNSLLV